MLDRKDNVAVLVCHSSEDAFATGSCAMAVDTMKQLSDDAEQLDISVVKSGDGEVVSKHNVISFDDLPVLLFYSHGVPTLYPGSIVQDSSDGVLAWLRQRRSGLGPIKLIPEQMMSDLVMRHPFVAVLLTGVCAEDGSDDEVGRGGRRLHP